MNPKTMQLPLRMLACVSHHPIPLGPQVLRRAGAAPAEPTERTQPRRLREKNEQLREELAEARRCAGVIEETQATAAQRANKQAETARARLSAAQAELAAEQQARKEDKDLARALIETGQVFHPYKRFSP
jgi:hypothetical protein